MEPYSDKPTFLDAFNIKKCNKGDIVGTISYYDKDGLIAETKLLADNSVEKEPWYSIVFRFIVKIIVSIITLFITLILLLIIFNKIRRFRNKNRERIFY